MDHVRFRVSDGNFVEEASFATQNTTEGLVSALEKAKESANTSLSVLVSQFKGAELDEQELEEEVDPAANEEPDLVEEQLHVLKAPKKKSKAVSDPHSVLLAKASASGLEPSSRAFARALDAQDALAALRSEFWMPKHGDGEALYFCGNSLGLQPKTVRLRVEEELLSWQTRGVEGHFRGERPWAHTDDFVRKQMARVVGAQTAEVVVMNGLTTNLHLMMIPFYQPTARRFRILIEKKSFPSDLYAVQSQILLRGFKVEDALVEIAPRNGEFTLRTEDILAEIGRLGDSLALVMFSGVQYYTGQLFDMKRITAAGKRVGANVGFDLAHAVGNAVVELHDWQVDFAVWCSYKYLNSGPGGIAGAFLHSNHFNNKELQRLGGK